MINGADEETATLIRYACGEQVDGIPYLEWEIFQEIAGRMGPTSYTDLGKILGLCWSDRGWIPVQQYLPLRKPAIQENLVGTKEDVFDIFLRNGVPREDAFAIMEMVRVGHGKEVFSTYREELSGKSFTREFRDTIENVHYLFSRGQCLNYLHWSLVLLWYKLNR